MTHSAAEEDSARREATAEDLLRLQQAQADAVLSGDPQALRDLASELPSELAEMCARVDPLGLRVAHLLTDKLRFDRLIQGLDDGRARFENDPEGFVREFRTYLAAVPPRALEPRAEARAFRDWQRSQSIDRPS